MNAINSMSNVVQTTNKPLKQKPKMAKVFLYEQRKRSNYKTPQESKETIHKILHTKGLKLKKEERPLRKIFKYLWNCKGGVTKASIEEISEYMTKKLGRGYGLTSMETSVRVAKECGLLTMEYTYSEETGHKTCAWKIVAPAEVIEEFIQARITPIEEPFEEPFEGSFEGSFEVRAEAETPCESKDEGPKNEPYKTILNNIKNNKRNIPIPISSLSTNIEYNQEKKVKDEYQTISYDLSQSNIIPNKIKNYLKEHLERLTAMNFDVVEYERFIKQYPYIDLTAEYENFNYINKDDLYFITRQLIKEIDVIKTTTYGLMKNWAIRYLSYKCENIMSKFEEQQIVENETSRSFDNIPFYYDYLNSEPQEATGEPQNEIEYQDNQLEQTASQEQNYEPTNEDFDKAFFDPFAVYNPFDFFEKELNRDGDWVTPLPPLSEKDDLKYYDSIIAQEPQEEPLEELNEVCV